ncbi:TetR/AcrR family transcriptional regulator [Marinobacterium rhizophilum]|uniref:TetR family transcriptional regulator n=1 Tax=Marinobacterium rhizophilum TaxID=420402 RepID=A0ABY5HRV3_9GAMM|nr:TetR/AcrR family transcriptional regulator [Marinobacterium rhizophilum]UTW13656.1 TetR family transcriptional regulator [Marinobacterium rhizophilum]
MSDSGLVDKTADKTKDKILQAAASLFAEQGFNDTTMRQITARAEVNLAAVNYHFGSKERLILALADRCIEPLVSQLERLLAERLALAPQRLLLDELMEMLMRTLLGAQRNSADGLSVFMRLLDLAYVGRQQVLREHLVAAFGSRLQPFMQYLRADAAPMDDDEFFWRLHFLLGSVIFSLVNFQTLVAIEQQALDLDAEVEHILHRLVPVLCGGFQARAENTRFCWL